jgi:hypothetical protein
MVRRERKMRGCMVKKKDKHLEFGVKLLQERIFPASSPDERSCRKRLQWVIEAANGSNVEQAKRQ